MQREEEYYIHVVMHAPLLRLRKPVMGQVYSYVYRELKLFEHIIKISDDFTMAF